MVGKIEDKSREERDQEAGNYEIACKKESLSSDVEAKNFLATLLKFCLKENL